ncbi:MAG: hypothetical protein IKJ08_08610 [Alistipes sp.]|nr:hypothetical protein [Alistipes sp.]
MKRLLPILSLLFMTLLGGCTAMMESSSYGSSDLYVTDNRIRVAEELKAKAEAERAEAEARKAMWEARLAEIEYYNATGENYYSILANDYESAYARRLYGFNSPTYRLPASYYNLSMNDAMRYATAYDPAFYNIMVSGDQVWVEPKYVTSMFGSWGATNVSFGIYASPWVYGWGIYADPFYYTMWGYPRYSWYDWNWHMCYNPYHWGYYPGYHHHHYYPHHGHNAHPPHYRPDHRPNKPGSNVGSTVVHRGSGGRNTASRYTSPTSNKNYGNNLNGSRVGNAIRNSGSTSSGINHSTVNRGNSGSSRGNTRYSTSTQRRSEQSSGFRSSSSGASSSRGGTISSSSSSRSSSSSSSSRSSSSSSSRSSSGSTSSRR